MTHRTTIRRTPNVKTFSYNHLLTHTHITAQTRGMMSGNCKSFSRYKSTRTKNLIHYFPHIFIISPSRHTSIPIRNTTPCIIFSFSPLYFIIFTYSVLAGRIPYTAVYLCPRAYSKDFRLYNARVAFQQLRFTER